MRGDFQSAIAAVVAGTRCEKDGGELLRRDDDTESVILRRMAEFEKLSAPLVEYYRNSDYHRIDANRDAALISAELLKTVGRKQARAAA